jgi:hypothetical protein
MTYEYKTVGAPEKGKRRKGARTASDRAAAAFEEILDAEARDGWEYLRTDILPLIERSGWLGGRNEAHRAVMTFRRPVKRDRDVEPPRTAAEPQLRAVPNPMTREPTVSDDPELRLAEIVRGPGGPGGRDPGER